MVVDRIQRELNRCPALDEIVFRLQRGKWGMTIKANGPYTPKIDLYRAFISMLAEQPASTKSGLIEVFYVPEEENTRISGRGFCYKDGTASWHVYTPKSA